MDFVELAVLGGFIDGGDGVGVVPCEVGIGGALGDVVDAGVDEAQRVEVEIVCAGPGDLATRDFVVLFLEDCG